MRDANGWGWPIAPSGRSASKYAPRATTITMTTKTIALTAWYGARFERCVATPAGVDGRRVTRTRSRKMESRHDRERERTTRTTETTTRHPGAALIARATGGTAS